MVKKKDGENIRVVVRVRPLMGDEKERSEKESVRLDVASGQVQVHHNIGDPDVWTFDAVYNNSFSQRDIYRQEVAPLIDAVMNGYNATVFAYGQSGSGKTHTMTGKLDDPALQGMMPQAVEHIFKEVREQTSSTKSFKVKLSYLELYNGNARDLLQKKQVTLEIKENLSKNFYVKGAENVEVSNANECVHYFREGTDRRQTASTSLNESSSRSHSLFVITVEQYDFEQDATAPVVMSSKINIVDLAGSERQTKTGAAGDTLKEGCNINLSLSSLATVIDTIVKGAKHVPYRSSPLTKLLKDSLGGNSKTVMFANCGPSERNVSETISTLRFAERAKQIENKPVKNLDPKDAKIAELLAKIESLQEKLGKGGVNLEEEENLQERIEQLEIENQHLRGSSEKDTIDLEEQLKEKEGIIAKLATMVEESQKAARGSADEKQLVENKLQMESECVTQLKQLIADFIKRVCTQQQLNDLKGMLTDRDEISETLDDMGAAWDIKDLQAMLDNYVTMLPKWKGASSSREEVEKEVTKAKAAAENEFKARIADLERERNDLIAIRESESKKSAAETEAMAQTKADIQQMRDENAKLHDKVKRDQEKFKAKLEKLKAEAQQTRDEFDNQTAALKTQLEEKTAALTELQRVGCSAEQLEAERAQAAETKRQLTERVQETELRCQTLQSTLTEMEVVLKKKGIKVKSNVTTQPTPTDDAGQHPETRPTSVSSGQQQQQQQQGAAGINDAMMVFSDDDDEVVRHIQQQVRLQNKLYELRHAQQKRLESLLVRYAEIAKESKANVSEEVLQQHVREAIATKDKELDELKAEYQKTQEKLVKKVNKKLQEASEEKTVLEEENVELKEHNEKNEALINQMQLELQMTKSALEKKEQENETDGKLKDSEISHLRNQVEHARSAIEELQAQLEATEEMRDEHARLQEQYARTEASLKEKIVSLDNNRQMLKWSNSLLDQEKKNVGELEQRLKLEERKLMEAEEHFREELIDNSNKLVQINNRRLDEQAAQFQQQLHEEADKQKQLREKVRKAKAQTQKAKQKYDELVLENEVLQMHLEESKVALLKIIRQQQQGPQVDAFARPQSAYKRM